MRIAGVSIRLTDYDSPELYSPKCPKEHALAWQARRELQALLILAEAGSLTIRYTIVPCAYANYGRLCRASEHRWEATGGSYDRTGLRFVVCVRARILSTKTKLVSRPKVIPLAACRPRGTTAIIAGPQHP